MLRPFVLAVCPIVLAGCAAAASRAGPFTYACAEGKSFTAAFNAAGDAVTIAAGGDSRTLPQVVSASGARFSDGATQYWSKGREATLEGFPGGPLAACATH
jgi:membrane-bound inhibitor of C-type lysozyme